MTTIYTKEGLYAWFIEDGYLWDWLVTAIFLIISFFVPLKAVKPVTRFYLNNDPTLSYPYSENTISGTVLYILVLLLPAVVFCTCGLVRRSFHDWHHSLLAGIEAYAVATAWKRWMNLVGVYRPSWLSILATNDHSEIDGGNQSYPSGHSAYMFSTMTVVSLFLIGKLGVMSSPTKGQFPLALVCLIPVALATFVAVTRIYDYKHAPADVNAGCFIGFLSGAFAYFLNYPSLLDSQSREPNCRAWTTSGWDVVRSIKSCHLKSLETGQQLGEIGRQGLVETVNSSVNNEDPEFLCRARSARSGRQGV
ncbi:hypothetical protein CEUSTIGMA_g10792.t1 [Chlamydomonas eustigma]|uniref:Phosphatidic acid phosphatase type 2/haloperoxidase domain-containing protein n=1 Tax=Chlamydomonas eustigma TaxID=1157962 RepID=A0A250XJX2_9CHLO|nr:hypothetical protein CEUSTIGMA_g10792.t1 [Chlamydomonas eustigma]|eukprot:GAX83367.1 hypothetical protein CEUSTIGMA_g10792.t1 [Chlamydomonas eustigma]